MRRGKGDKGDPNEERKEIAGAEGKRPRGRPRGSRGGHRSTYSRDIVEGSNINTLDKYFLRSIVASKEERSQQLGFVDEDLAKDIHLVEEAAAIYESAIKNVRGDASAKNMSGSEVEEVIVQANGEERSDNKENEEQKEE